MVYSPYDWTQNLQHRQEYVQDRLREGSPVTGVSYRDGVMLLTVRKTQDKIFEIYDLLIFSGLGHQSDLETLRLAATDFAHQEGFARSPVDVTAQRVVGVALSPVLKRSFGDFFSAPLVVRSLFAELGESAADDLFYSLDFDGEFSLHRRFAAVGGSPQAEAEMQKVFSQEMGDDTPDMEGALRVALRAWAQGRRRGTEQEADGDDAPAAEPPGDFIKRALEAASIEAAVLERDPSRANKFRHLSQAEIAPALEALLGG